MNLCFVGPSQHKKYVEEEEDYPLNEEDINVSNDEGGDGDDDDDDEVLKDNEDEDENELNAMKEMYENPEDEGNPGYFKYF